MVMNGEMANKCVEELTKKNDLAFTQNNYVIFGQKIRTGL